MSSTPTSAPRKALSKPPLRVAIIGLGGFARLHHESLRVLESEGMTRLVATCDPALDEAAPEVVEELRARGVHLYRDYTEMLDAHWRELDFVTIPTPIPLHAPMHRACVERGLAVYLEKPPTLDPRELQEMISVERNASFQTQVGFNFIIEAPRQILKMRLLRGEFGALKRAGFLGLWPRPQSYFQRASWAGRLRQNGRLVLDSCVGNAMAHYVHNLLFWCGDDGIFSWGEPDAVEAELYRAHSIESFDTVFARGVCGDSEILLGASHAGEGHSWHREWLECERASILYTARDNTFVIHWRDGRRTEGATDSDSTAQFLTRNLRHFARYLNGDEPRPQSTLADAGPLVHLHALLFLAAKKIVDVPDEFIERSTDTRGNEFAAIENIGDHLDRFSRDGRLPFEAGAPWGQSGGRATAADLWRLDDAISQIAASTSANLP